MRWRAASPPSAIEADVYSCWASGGGAGHASHAVNDFRKLCGLESYAPTDNVSELTARANDEGWETAFTRWLEVSRLSDKDGLLAFSVGGGSREPPVSANLAAALEYAQGRDAQIYGIVGAPGGVLAELADVAIVIDPPPDLRTPLVESFQAVVWHALVSHPVLAIRQGHWEELAAIPRHDRHNPEYWIGRRLVAGQATRLDNWRV